MLRLLLALSLLTFQFQGLAQEPFVPGATYKGLRLGLYHFEVLRQSSASVSLRCDLANTGRYALSFDKKHPPPAALVIEFDTLNLPQILSGLEENMGRALFQQDIALAPGEIRQGLLLKVALVSDHSAPENDTTTRTATRPAHPACGDFVFDTAFVLRRDPEKVVLHFTLRNAGQSPIQLNGNRKGEKDPITMNAYFVRGAKLTRGAILATTISLSPGGHPDGLLLPGASIESEIEISLAARTQFSPNIILEINPFQTATECDFTNNTRGVPLDF